MNDTKQWGGVRKGAGRPKGSTKAPEDVRSKRIVILATPAQETALKERAKAAGMTVSAYLLSLAFK